MATKQQDRESIVAKAIEIESAKERDAFIAQACGDDEALKQHVQEQVAAHFHATNQQGPNGSPDRDAIPSQRNAKQDREGHTESQPQPLTRLGPYEALKLIGDSVTSTVYRAEQYEPVRRAVALRVLKEGLDWRSIHMRLEAVGQTLVRMDNSHIAPLLEFGVRQSGQPYLVTEWVDGPPITRYCDEQKLAIPKRLELFLAVCEGVQYAHQKGILHGGLAPSKVLVATKNDQPVPRVFDFGVAGILRGQPTSTASASKPNDRNVHAEYLSPEQADANNPDVDARSDVYGLGILLYELLTGTTPLPSERLKDVSAQKAMQMVREEKVLPPSKRLDEMKDRPSSDDQQRPMQPKALAKAMNGELDCVVMKALEKAPARRYATVSDLARDLRRYLDDEPLEACPPSTRARLWKSARKHPRLATTAVLVLLLLLTAAAAGTGLALWAFHAESKARQSAQEAREKEQKAEKEEAKTKGKLQQVEEKHKATVRERDRVQEEVRGLRRSEEDTKAVLDFFKDKFLSAGRPSDAPLMQAFWKGVQEQGKDVTLKKAVDTAAAKVSKMFTDRPLAEVGARELIGLAYLNLGEAAQAVPQYERALELRKALQGLNDSATSDCRNKLAFAYRLAGRPTDASSLFEENSISADRAAALATRGSLLLKQKKPDQAELLLRECLAIRQQLQPDDWRTDETRSLLGEALVDQKKYGEAEPLLLAGYKGMKKHKDDIPIPEQARLPQTLERLVRLYTTWGKSSEAAKWKQELQSMKP